MANAYSNSVLGVRFAAAGAAVPGPDILARAQIAAITGVAGDVISPGETTWIPTVGAFHNRTAGSLTVPVGPSSVNMIATGFVSDLRDNPEVIIQAGPLAGVAPVGAKWGVDSVSSLLYAVVAGSWVELPRPMLTPRVATGNTAAVTGDVIQCQNGAVTRTITIGAGVTHFWAGRDYGSTADVFVIPPVGFTVAGDVAGGTLNDLGQVLFVLNSLTSDYVAVVS